MITLGTSFTGIAGLFAPGMRRSQLGGFEADDAVFGGGAKTADAGTLFLYSLFAFH